MHCTIGTKVMKWYYSAASEEAYDGVHSIEEIGSHTIIVYEYVHRQTEEQKRLEESLSKTTSQLNFLIIQAAKIFNLKPVPSSDADCAAYGKRILSS